VNAACVQMQWDLEAAKALGPTLAILAAAALPYDGRWLSAAAEWASSCGAPPGKTSS